MLWEDHRNDLFINGFGTSFIRFMQLIATDRFSTGILMSAGGSKLAWWLDPTGAIVVSTPSEGICPWFDSGFLY